MQATELETSLSRVHEWIRAADAKVSIWLAFLGVVITISAPSLIKGWFFMRIARSCTFSIPFTVAMLLLLVSLAKAFSAIMPRVYKDQKNKSLIFFGDIAILERAEYFKALEEYSAQDYLTDLKNQIYISSGIAKRKHDEFRASLITFISGMAVFGISFLALSTRLR